MSDETTPGAEPVAAVEQAAPPVVVDDTDAPDAVKTSVPETDPTDDTAEPDEISFIKPDGVNVHPDDEALWQQRARAYDSQYAGPEHWRRVLNILAATGSIPSALRVVGFSRTKFTLRRERYVEFGEAVQQALDYYRHTSIEGSIRARAIDGVLEPVWHKGAHCGYKRVYSDTLLIRLAEAEMPEKYKPKMDVSNTINVTATGGIPDQMTEEELAVEAEKAAQRRGETTIPPENPADAPTEPVPDADI